MLMRYGKVKQTTKQSNTAHVHVTWYISGLGGYLLSTCSWQKSLSRKFVRNSLARELPSKNDDHNSSENYNILTVPSLLACMCLEVYSCSDGSVVMGGVVGEGGGGGEDGPVTWLGGERSRC